jgi:hypothetical protein
VHYEAANRASIHFLSQSICMLRMMDVAAVNIILRALNILHFKLGKVLKNIIIILKSPTLSFTFRTPHFFKFIDQAWGGIPPTFSFPFVEFVGYCA